MAGRSGHPAGTSKGGNKQAACNCEICSAAVGKAPRTALPPRGAAAAELLGTCRTTCTNIIRRNKHAVRILSNQVRKEKQLNPPCASRYDTVKLFPTAKCAHKWSKAYSQARESTTTCKRKPVPPIQTSLMNIVTERRDCACELMANAIRADLHRHMGLSERRTRINEGFEDEPTEPAPTKPDPMKK